MNKITWLHLSDSHFFRKIECQAASGHDALLAFLTGEFAGDLSLNPDDNNSIDKDSHVPEPEQPRYGRTSS